MSRTILAAFVLGALLVALCAGSVQAQTSANTDITASATVMTALTLTKGADLAFGNISATTPGVVYMNPTSAAGSAYVGSTAAIGTFQIAGGGTAMVIVTWPTSVDLISGSDHLNCDLAVSGGTTGARASSGSLTSGTGYALAAGAFYLWVGGRLGGVAGTPAALSSQATGTYSGIANFTVEYQ